MREIIRMITVLTVLCAFSGGLLAALRDGTEERIENQQLEFVKGPAIRSILKGSSNDPIKDRFKIKDGGSERNIFVGRSEGKPETVAFETSGKGFKGDISMMVGVNITDDKIVGIGITTHSETPGIGAKAQTDPKFSGQFKGMPLTGEFKIKKEGGQIDAISGATITSRGVAFGVSDAAKIYSRIKPAVSDKLNELK